MSDRTARLAAALADRYVIEGELGQGGMATVYLAEDLKHHRKVAIKVLKPELAAVLGADRFIQEIETTAQLQHPHILPLFDSGEADGFLYYVMPYVEGETLRDRLDRETQLPVDEALRITIDVADALEYAHEHGVIHRDIKPENILLHGGRAMVADFGIALAVTSAGGGRLTETGISLGTPRYMSPEQATGQRNVTVRSDIYALGATAYEMLVGEPPFTGPNVQAIVAKVVTETPPPIRTRRHTVPLAVDRTIAKALEKLPADRVQTAAEFIAALRAPAELPAPRRRSRIVTAALVVLLGPGTFVLGRITSGHGQPIFSVERMTKVTWDDGIEALPAMSPDGRSIAYVAGTSTRMRIFVRQVSGGRELPVSDDSAATEWGPQWSPDGTRVLFVTPTGVFSAPAGGGHPRPEVPGDRRPVISATWSPDGRRIAFVVEDTLFVREADGTIRELARLHAPGACAWSARGLLACAAGNPLRNIPGINFGNMGPGRIVVVRAADGEVHTVTDSNTINWSPTWTPDGWLLYLSTRAGSADIYAVRVTKDGAAEGATVRVTTGLQVSSLSASADGTRLAFANMTTTANIWSLPIPAAPPVSVRAATQITRGRQMVESLSVSDDSRWLLYDSDVSGNVNVYRLRLPGGRPEQLTFLPGDEFSPSLSPDGTQLVYHAWHGVSREIYLQPLDGGPVEQLTISPEQEARPRWSPDGRALTWYDVAIPGGVWVSRPDANGRWTARRLALGFWSAWSPDGALLSYSTGRSGGHPMVVPADSGAPRDLMPGAEWPQVTTSGWSADGRTVYFKGVDSTGATDIWALPRAGGIPKLMVRLDDPTLTPERHTFAVGAGAFFFTRYDRQSDVWVMRLERRGS